ncbi:TonB-dependent receptor, partial [bacterium]|nr:TonB-dependent receptor [bacterium]
GTARNTDPESLFEGGVDGAKVPYIPDYQINAEFGLEYGRVGAYVSFTYVPATFTSASNTSAQVRSDGTPDARVGETDSYFITDLSVRYQLRERTTLFGGVRNLFDREYVSSRHPHGPRPGLPQFFNAGVEVFF